MQNKRKQGFVKCKPAIGVAGLVCSGVPAYYRVCESDDNRHQFCKVDVPANDRYK